MTEPRPAALLLDTAALLALGTALLVTAGWGYAERWFAWFDLGVIGLGIPPAYLAMYGYWTLAAHGWWLLLAAAVVAIGWQGIKRVPPLGGDRLQRRLAPLLAVLTPALVPMLLLAITLLLFWAAYGQGGLAADRDHARARASGFCALPQVRVVLKEPSAGLATTLPGTLDALAAGRYRLLIQSGGLLALIRGQAGDVPDQTESSPPLRPPASPRRPALIVPVDQVALFELIPVNPGCGPS